MPSVEIRSLVLTALASLLLPACGTGSIDLFGLELGDAAVTDGVSITSPPEAAADGGCTSDAQCTSAGAHRCDAALHQCVECVADLDCVGRNDSRCNQVTHGCVLPCTTTGDCLGSDVCDTSQLACADCLVDSQCDKTEPHCVSEECICLVDSECAPDKRCWVGACVSCVTTADCPAGKACTANHDCE
jgi:hypothetical protein